MSRTTLWVLSLCTVAVLVAVTVGLIFADSLPYGQKHFRQIWAVKMSSEVLAWKKAGARDEDLAVLESRDKSNTISRFKTNIVFSGQTHTTLIKVESTKMGDGILFVTDAGDAFWSPRDGSIQQIYIHRKRDG